MKLKYVIVLLISLVANSFFSQTLATSLTACYALNANGTEPINNLTGTLSAVTATVDRFSNANSAVHFNGNPGSFIALPNSPLLKSTNAVSFSAWIKLDNITQSHYIVFAHNTCASYHEGYTLITQNLGPGYKLHLVKSSSACSPATQMIVSSSSNLVANTWYHIGGYIGNDSLKVYVNGALQGFLPITIPFSYNASENVYLGGTGLAFNLPMLGSLDNVRFYNRKLTDGEFNQLYLTDPACVAVPAPVNCNNSFYAHTSAGVYESNTSLANTSTLTTLPLPPGASGLAIGPAFGFPAPNPTYWTVSGGSFWYYNGTAFVNTTHSTGHPNALHIGGSKNFIYNITSGLNSVYKYNGTGPATLVLTPAVPNSALDIVGDEDDNFYLLHTQPPQSLSVHNQLGVQTCSYIIAGIPFTPGPADAFAIVNNTVTAFTSSGYYVGTMSPTMVSFTQTPPSFATPTDFANCYVSTSFSSTITSSPSSSISCSSPSITLTANATLSPLSYTWTGPGILTPINNQTVLVNAPGVYTCSLTTTTGCPTKKSVSTFTVLNGPTSLTPTISLTNTLSCTSPNATLSVLPNTAQHVFLWAGAGLSSYTTPTTVASAGGIFTVTVTNTLTGCSGTQTINVPSSISTLTINAATSSTQICSPSAAIITLTATGATNYTWTPIGATIPGTGSVVATTPTITTTYTVTGSTGACTGSTSITISVTPTPTLVATGSPTVCSGSPTTLSVTGATSYTWMPGSLTGSTVTVSPTVTTNYTITGANGVCTSTTALLLTVVPIPTITASASPTIICQGGTSTLTANGAITYTWQPGNLSGNTVTVSPLTTTIYTVSGKNVLGCSSSTTVQLVVNNPTISVSPLSNTICSGNSVTITGSGASSYTWNPGAFTTSSIVVSPTINTTYTLISISGVCTSTTYVPIFVAANPTILTAPINPTICNGSSTTLTASGGVTYTWMPIAVVGSVIVVSPSGPMNYTVTGTNAAGCTNTNVATVIVNPSPTVSAVSNPTSICGGSGASVTLTANGASTYTWLPGPITGSNVVVTPTTTTIYTVTGTNGFNCTNTKTVSVFVSSTLTINIVASPTVICNGGTATLTASGATTYTWMPGTLTGTSVVVSPTATTVYTVTGAFGTCNSTKTFTLSVLPRPNISITAIPPVICRGGSGVLLALGATNYTWSPGSSTGNTLAITPSVTSTYTVTGTNAAGCTNTAITTVTVNPTPTITVIASSNTLCSGNSVTLTSSGAINYITLPGGQTGSVLVVSPTVNTTYTITGLNASGCTDTETISISIAAGPTISATSSNTLLCDGGTFSLSASGATNYTWMPVNLTGSTIATIASTLINTYTVVGESGGCVNTASVGVVVISCNNTMFGMTKAAGKPVLVYNSFYNVTFTITAVNASTINLTNVSLDENLSTAFPAPTNFSVVNQPIITSQNSSLSINPLFDGVSQISLTSPSTSTLLANKRDTIVFTVRIDPKGYFGPFKNSVIGFAQFINNVIVSDSSNNGFVWDPDSDGDPTNNDTATVINLDPIDLFIPDGFSPDGDGKNDVFFIKGLNARPVKLTVFNRWGNKIYENGEYDNAWNAYPNVSNALGNNKVPQGTYYYVIEFLDGDKETRTGFVVIQY